jgi:hypothetical protein
MKDEEFFKQLRDSQFLKKNCALCVSHVTQLDVSGALVHVVPCRTHCMSDVSDLVRALRVTAATCRTEHYTYVFPVRYELDVCII